MLRTLLKGIKSISRNKRLEVTSLFYILLISFSSYYVFLHANSVVSSRVNGPLYFNLQAFMPLGILISVVTFLLLLHRLKMHIVSPVVLLYICFLLKILVVYFVFNGNVNYDTPAHYTSALYLADYGINPSYHYHSWPSALILVDIVRTVTGFSYPADASVVAVLSRFLIPLTVYALALRAFNSRELGILALSVLIMFEPFILHYSPQIVGVAVYVVFIYVLSLMIMERTLTHTSILVPVILFTPLLAYHAMLPISAALVIIGFSLLLVTLLHLSNNSTSTNVLPYQMPYLRVLHYLMIFTLFGVLVYNLSITLFVTRSIIKTFELLLSGGSVRLDVYGFEIRSPDLAWQYSIIGSINRTAILLVLGIPSIYVLYRTIYKFIKGRADSLDYLLLFIAIVSGLNTGIHFIGMVLQTGLTERYFQIGIIFASILSAYFYKTALTPRTRKGLAKATSVTFTVIFALFSALSIFIAGSYQDIYRSAFDGKETFMAKWVANNIDNTIVYLDGTPRLNQLIIYYMYPSRIYNVDIFVTSYIDDVVMHRAKYPSGILITVTPLSYIKTSWKYRLSDTILKEYFENLKYSENLVFNDGSNSCYVV